MNKQTVSSKLITLGCMFILVVLLPGSTASAHKAATQPQRALLSAQQPGPTDPVELETFLDAFFAE